MNDKYLVTQANELIISRHDLTTAELKIVLSLVSLIQPEDDDFKMYRLKITEFAELIGVSGESQYTHLHKITQNLIQKLIQFKGKKRTLQMTWLASADYKYGEGIIELEISQKLRPYLLGLKSQFTTYQLMNILRLTGKYSIRLYQLLKSYEHRQILEIQITELSEMFQLSKTYSDFYHVRHKILEPAKAELAEKTDICFTYEEIKERKKVVALKFYIRANPKNKPKKALPEPPPETTATTQTDFQAVQAEFKRVYQSLPERRSAITGDSSALTETTPTSQTNVQAIQAEFQRLYGGELIDRFVAQMLTEKGLEHVRECLRTYKDYIQGQQIRNLGGHFREFVMSGYQKPTSNNGKDTITAPKYEAFRATDEERREVEESYKQIVESSFKSMREFLGGRIKIPET